jgi:cation transport regulator ChaB
MPFPTVADLPKAVRDAYSGRCLQVFREAFNAAFKTNADERVAFQVAHTAARKCKESRA